MSRRHRVAFASEAGGALALGDPERRHLRLDPLGLLAYGLGPDHSVVPAGPALAWDDIRGLEINAPAGFLRFPGAASALLAAGLGAMGFDHVPSTADIDVTIQTQAGERHVTCDGFLGGSYWHPHVSGLKALMALLVDEPAARSALEDPERLMSGLRSFVRKH